jgi:hypothetical protein
MMDGNPCGNSEVTNSKGHDMMRPLIVLLFTVGVMLPASPGWSQGVAAPTPSAQITLDTPGMVQGREWSARLDTRAFSEEENLTYVNLAIQIVLGDDWEGIVRGSYSERQVFNLPGGGGIRHGGTDIEAAAKYRFPVRGRLSTAALFGLSFPSTPAQDDAVFSLGFSVGSSLGNRTALFVNPRAVLLKRNTIVGIGLGWQTGLSGALSLVAEFTPVVSGDNTRSEVTGARQRRNLYGIAVRYGPTGSRYSIDLGFTNAIGLTTGSALTPGLGGSGAFYAALAGRF